MIYFRLIERSESSCTSTNSIFNAINTNLIYIIWLYDLYEHYLGASASLNGIEGVPISISDSKRPASWLFCDAGDPIKLLSSSADHKPQWCTARPERSDWKSADNTQYGWIGPKPHPCRTTNARKRCSEPLVAAVTHRYQFLGVFHFISPE